MMNYCDYDSDGYSSNEDADYIPSDDNLSEDDINECEKEDPLHEDDAVPHPGAVTKTKRKKKSSVRNLQRKRTKGVLKLETEEVGESGKAQAQTSWENQVQPTVAEKDDEENQKKKSDDLWARFLSDVGSRPKESSPASQSSITQKADSSVVKVATTETKALQPAKIIITKVFDFAGEEVRVNKEVSADSREAKSFLKSQSTTEEGEDTKMEEEKSSSSRQPSAPGTSAKRLAGMSNILSCFGGKKQKMSTLEKSKMDWDAFKSEEGITEELAIHNRGREGFVERKKFLERVDHRQFELEKSVRLSNRNNDRN